MEPRPGFLIGRIDGEPVAICSAIRHGPTFGFFGFYIVAPAWRGQGHGLAMWHAAMARLKGCVVGLDGVVAQQHNYARSGFVEAYRQVRHVGRTRPALVDGAGLHPLYTVPTEHWLRYDRSCFPCDRRAYILPWVRPAGTVALCFVEAGVLKGYGVIRPCRSGHKIGPLFADDAAVAERLLAGLQVVVAANAEVFIDIPVVNAAAMALAERHGMTPVFETSRMYAGAQPQIDLQRQFGITSFELG